MAPIRMYIQKFGKEVLIEEDHPLVAEQRAYNARKGGTGVGALGNPGASEPATPKVEEKPAAPKRTLRRTAE